MSKHSRRYEKLYGEHGKLNQLGKPVKLGNIPQQQEKKVFTLSKEQVEQFEILEDNYPVFWDYLYLVDGKVTRSDIQGDVKQFKRDLRTLGRDAIEVRRLDWHKYKDFENAS